MTKEQIEAIDALWVQATAGQWMLTCFEGPDHKGIETYSLCSGEADVDDHRCLGHIRGETKEHARANCMLTAALHNSWPAIRAALLEQSSALDLLGDDTMFVRNCADGTKRFYVLCSDTFGYACADAEEVTLSECVEVKRMHDEGGWLAVVRWIAERRKEAPIKPVADAMSRSDAMRAELEQLRAKVAQYELRERVEIADEMVSDAMGG